MQFDLVLKRWHGMFVGVSGMSVGQMDMVTGDLMVLFKFLHLRPAIVGGRDTRQPSTYPRFVASL
jgi:hypothetical protein